MQPARERAALLIATALGLGDVISSLPALAQLSPHACQPIAEDLLAR